MLMGRSGRRRSQQVNAADKAKLKDLGFKNSAELESFLKHGGGRGGGRAGRDTFGDANVFDGSGISGSHGGTGGYEGHEFSHEGEDGEIKPCIIYAGVDHRTPAYAGKLPPIRYRLHALEFHQLLEGSNAEDHTKPWFIQNGLSPQREALHGPVPLPFKPRMTGMPAPTFTTLESEGQPNVVIADLIQQAFPDELPTRYSSQPKKDSRKDTQKGGRKGGKSKDAEGGNDADEEGEEGQGSAQGSAEKGNGGVFSPGTLVENQSEDSNDRSETSMSMTASMSDSGSHTDLKKGHATPPGQMQEQVHTPTETPAR